MTELEWRPSHQAPGDSNQINTGLLIGTDCGRPGGASAIANHKVHGDMEEHATTAHHAPLPTIQGRAYQSGYDNCAYAQNSHGNLASKRMTKHTSVQSFLYI